MVVRCRSAEVVQEGVRKDKTRRDEVDGRTDERIGLLKSLFWTDGDRVNADSEGDKNGRVNERRKKIR